MFDSLVSQGCLEIRGEDVVLTAAGRSFASGFGIGIDSLSTGRRPLCKSCLDWSARRTHLAGALGAALLSRFYEESWAVRLEGSRTVEFSSSGETRFTALFPV